MSFPYIVEPHLVPKLKKKPLLILISGKSDSGKGTVAEYMESAFKSNPEYFVVRASLSTWIRETLKSDFFWDGQEDTDVSRTAMAEIYRAGTNFYPYHMMRRVWERDVIPALLKNDDKCSKSVVIIESFREKVNYDYCEILRERGHIDFIITVSVERPEPMKEYNEFIKSHVSEMDLTDFQFDFYLYNTGTLKDLREKTQETINRIYEL